jgi:hypothetical protein
MTTMMIVAAASTTSTMTTDGNDDDRGRRQLRASGDTDSEDAGELELVELGREDSNLQLPG